MVAGREEGKVEGNVQRSKYPLKQLVYGSSAMVGAWNSEAVLLRLDSIIAAGQVEEGRRKEVVVISEMGRTKDLSTVHGSM